MINTPFELLKCRQQMMEEKFISLKDLTKLIIRETGFIGLYKGFCVTFNRDFISYGLYFLTFYSIKDYLEEKNKLTQINIMLAGGISGNN